MRRKKRYIVRRIFSVIDPLKPTLSPVYHDTSTLICCLQRTLHSGSIQEASDISGYARLTFPDESYWSQYLQGPSTRTLVQVCKCPVTVIRFNEVRVERALRFCFKMSTGRFTAPTYSTKWWRCTYWNYFPANSHLDITRWEAYQPWRECNRTSRNTESSSNPQILYIRPHGSPSRGRVLPYYWICRWHVYLAETRNSYTLFSFVKWAMASSPVLCNLESRQLCWSSSDLGLGYAMSSTARWSPPRTSEGLFQCCVHLKPKPH